MLAELPIFIVAPLLLQPKSNAVSGRVQAMLFSQTAPDAPSMASCSFVVARMDRNPESMSAVSRTWDWRTSVRQAPLSSCPGGPETILFGSTTVSRALANPGMPRFTATAEFLLATWATAMMRSSALIAVSSCDMLFTSPALSPSKSPSFNVADFTPTNCVLRASTEATPFFARTFTLAASTCCKPTLVFNNCSMVPRLVSTPIKPIPSAPRMSSTLSFASAIPL